jgi:hypothetical protein
VPNRPLQADGDLVGELGDILTGKLTEGDSLAAPRQSTLDSGAPEQITAKLVGQPRSALL